MSDDEYTRDFDAWLGRNLDSEFISLFAAVKQLGGGGISDAILHLARISYVRGRRDEAKRHP